MIYLVTHAQRESHPDPGHTDRGMLSLVSQSMMGIIHLISHSFKRQNVVYVGTGSRFREMQQALSAYLDYLEIKYDPTFGSEVSRRDRNGETYFLFPDGTEKSEQEYIPLEKRLSVAKTWRIIKSKPVGSLLLTGREFYSCFRQPGVFKSCSIYELNPRRRSILPLVTSGQIDRFQESALATMSHT